jgi:Arc/MetJ-type ribon-helix-helix transcriptional regulator
MRAIINISVPQEVKKEMDIAVKQGGFSTKSEFVRDLMRLWRQEQILKELRQSQQEFARGKGKILKSLKDLRQS